MINPNADQLSYEEELRMLESMSHYTRHEYLEWVEDQSYEDCLEPDPSCR